MRFPFFGYKRYRKQKKREKKNEAKLQKNVTDWFGIFVYQCFLADV